MVAAELATAPANRHKLVDGTSRVTSSMIEGLEAEIDAIVAEVGMPGEFVVPGGSPAAAAIDVARTVVRRAERRAVELADAGDLEDSDVVRYLNRLADYLYMLARAVEGEWTPSRHKGGRMIEVVAGPELGDGDGDALVIPVFADLTWGPGAEWAADALGSWVVGYLEAQDFTGKTGQTAILPGGDSVPYARVVFLGLGDEVDAEGLRRAAGVAGSATRRYERVVTTLHELEVDEPEELVTLGYLLGQYRFEKYLSDPKPSKTLKPRVRRRFGCWRRSGKGKGPGGRGQPRPRPRQ